MGNELHPTGYFEAEILSHRLEKSKSGTDHLTVKYKTQSGTITGWFPLTDRAIEYTIEKLRNMGFVGRTFATLNDGEHLAGKFCTILVAHEEYGGKVYAKIKRVYALGFEGSESNATRFDPLLRAQNPAADARPATGIKPPRHEQRQPEYDDDEIPF